MAELARCEDDREELALYATVIGLAGGTATATVSNQPLLASLHLGDHHTRTMAGSIGRKNKNGSFLPPIRKCCNRSLKKGIDQVPKLLLFRITPIEGIFGPQKFSEFRKVSSLAGDSRDQGAVIRDEAKKALNTF